MLCYIASVQEYFTVAFVLEVRWNYGFIYFNLLTLNYKYTYMKIITTTAVGVFLAVAPFATPFAFAATATTTTTAPTATITTVAQSVSGMQATLQAQISQLIQQIKALQVQIAQIKTTQQTIKTSFVALRSQMRVGSRGRGVRVLQKLLASDPSIYPQGLVTGYYGRLTQAAVKKFQENHGISPVGEVGPETRMLMNSFLKRATSTIPMNFLREVEGEQRSATSTDRMVTVCHRAGNSGMMVSERIARRALFFHVRHGDSIGECDGEQNDNGSEQESLQNGNRGEHEDRGEQSMGKRGGRNYHSYFGAVHRKYSDQNNTTSSSSVSDGQDGEQSQGSQGDN